MPPPNKLALLMQMQPRLLKNPANVKISQGDAYDYKLPDIAEPSEGVSVIVQMDQKMQAFASFREKDLTLLMKTDITKKG